MQKFARIGAPIEKDKGINNQFPCFNPSNKLIQIKTKRSNNMAALHTTLLKIKAAQTQLSKQNAMITYLLKT